MEICLLAQTVLVVALVFIAVSNRRDMWALHKKIMEMNAKVSKLKSNQRGTNHKIPLIIAKLGELHPSCYRKQTEKELHDEAIIRLDLDVEPLGRTERFT